VLLIRRIRELLYEQGFDHQRRAQPPRREPERGVGTLRDLVGLCATRPGGAEPFNSQYLSRS